MASYEVRGSYRSNFAVVVEADDCEQAEIVFLNSLSRGELYDAIPDDVDEDDVDVDFVTPWKPKDVGPA